VTGLSLVEPRARVVLLRAVLAATGLEFTFIITLVAAALVAQRHARVAGRLDHEPRPATRELAVPPVQLISYSIARSIEVAGDGSLTVEGANHPDVEVYQLPGGDARWIAVTVWKEAIQELDLVGGLMWRLVDSQGDEVRRGNCRLSDDRRHVLALPDNSAIEHWTFEVALRFRTEGLHHLEVDLAAIPGGVRMRGVVSPLARFTFPLSVRVTPLPT
jgi:hypothetical protein